MNEDLRELFDRVAGQTYSEEGHSACVTCKRSVAILPLRYAVLGSAAPGESHLPVPELPKPLAPSTLVLNTARYTVRPLRHGFLYLFVQRYAADWVCEGAYQTYDSGLCKPLWPVNGDSAHYGSPMPIIGERVIRLTDPEAVAQARMLFTPDPLTPRLVETIRSDQRLRDTLRHLDMRQLVQSCHYSEHVLSPQQLQSRVADQVSQGSLPLARALAGQLFAPPSGFSVLDHIAPYLAADKISAQGFAVVLDDPLGITQELNAWRNQSAEVLQAFMDHVDSEGISNQRKHSIAFALDNLKTTLAEQARQRYVSHANTLGVRYTDPEYALSNAHMVGAAAGSYRSYPNPAEQQRQEQRAIEQAQQHRWDSQYAPYLDEPRIQAFLAEYQAAVERADQLKDARAADHLLWLQSSALLDALDYYDRRDPRSGLAFEAQLGAAVAGMNSTDAGEALLAQWSDTNRVSRSNLFWRGLGQNQSATLEQINSLLAQHNHLPRLDEAALQALTLGLTETFEKTHGLISEVSFDAPPTGIHHGGAVLMIKTFGTRLLDSRLAQLSDRPLNLALGWVLKARLGRLGQQLQFHNSGAPLSAGAQHKLNRAAARSLQQGLDRGTNAVRLDLRLGTTLSLLQLWNLKLRAEKTDKGSREYIELAAAMVAVSAAGLELAAVAVGLSANSRNQAIRQAGAVMGGGMKLMGGVLASGAAMVGTVFDYIDAADNYLNEKRGLGSLYLLRATAQAGIGFFSAAIGLALAGPFLEYLLKKHGSNHVMLKLLQPAVTTSTLLSLRMAYMLRWCIYINITTLALTLTLELTLPNALQNFLKHSTFRINRDLGTPASEEQELRNLNNAIKEAL